MIEYVNSLTPQEAEELKRTIRDLMRQSCIIETKYDTDRDCLKDNPRYRVRSEEHTSELQSQR